MAPKFQFLGDFTPKIYGHIIQTPKRHILAWFHVYNGITAFAEVKRAYPVTAQLLLVELQRFVSRNSTVYRRGGSNVMFMRDGFPTLHPIYFPILLHSFSIYKPSPPFSAVRSAERCMFTHWVWCEAPDESHVGYCVGWNNTFGDITNCCPYSLWCIRILSLAISAVPNIYFWLFGRIRIVRLTIRRNTNKFE